jgi:hypothetical protein
MALTLIEAAKLTDQPALQRAIINEFSVGEIMGSIPFENEEGSGVHYNKAEVLPAVGFRGLNEAFDESTGVINPESEAFRFYGGDMDVDRATVQLKGQSGRRAHEQLKIEALRIGWEYQVIKGDSATDPRGFDGLQRRITGNQLISNAAAGGALKLSKLDELLSQIKMQGGRTYLLMGRKMRDLLTAASRGTSVGGYITYGPDELGRKLPQYAGVPILVDDISSPVFPFTEASPDGTSSVCSSIYAVTFGPMMITGIQGRNDGASGGFGISARDLGEIDSKPVYRTRVDWNCSFAIYNGYAAARLYGITNAAVTT